MFLTPTCVFWDPLSLEWSAEGCFLDRRHSTGSTTVCRCEHLTNFGILFGGGDADAQVKSLLSIILGTVSVACLVVTVFFLHWFGYDLKNLGNSIGTIDLTSS